MGWGFHLLKPRDKLSHTAHGLHIVGNALIEQLETGTDRSSAASDLPRVRSQWECYLN